MTYSPETIDRQNECAVLIDIMFINIIPFIMTTLLNIHFGPAELVKDKKNKTIMASI